MTMNDQFDDQLRDFFRREDLPGLPSNFSWLVIQRIGRERIAMARSRAQLASLVISAVAFLCGVGLLLGYRLYISAPVAFVEVPTPALLSATILFAVWFLDTVVRSKS